MPTTINIWDEAKMEDLGATTGGTWTYVGTLTPAPTPPVTYNGTADFAAVTNAGDYPFKYEVISGSVTTSNIYTVAFDFFDTRTNDTCTGSTTVSTLAGYPLFVNFEDSLLAECPDGCETPTDSGVAIPSEWGSGAPFRDVWYQVFLSARSETKFIAITVDGSPFGDDGIDHPCIQVYLDTPGTACASITEIDAARGIQKSVTTTISVVAGTEMMMKLRISAPDGDGGKFDVTILNQ